MHLLGSEGGFLLFDVGWNGNLDLRCRHTCLDKVLYDYDVLLSRFERSF